MAEILSMAKWSIDQVKYWPNDAFSGAEKDLHIWRSEALANWRVQGTQLWRSNAYSIQEIKISLKNNVTISYLTKGERSLSPQPAFIWGKSHIGAKFIILEFFDSQNSLLKISTNVEKPWSSSNLNVWSNKWCNI